MCVDIVFAALGYIVGGVFGAQRPLGRAGVLLRV